MATNSSDTNKNQRTLLKFITSNAVQRELITISGLIILILAFKSSFLGNFTVPTGSMVPTIQIGDKLIANMVAYNLRVPFTNHVLVSFSTPKAGDIVVFDNPRDPSISYVKRLIGVPGDVIIVKDGFITVNGVDYKREVIDQPLVDVLEYGGTYKETGPAGSYVVQRKPHYNPYGFRDDDLEVREWTVPEGHYFFMGDNRDMSSDSRSWGFVPKNHIKGKALFVYFSMNWPEWLTVDVDFSRIGTVLR